MDLKAELDLFVSKAGTIAVKMKIIQSASIEISSALITWPQGCRGGCLFVLRLKVTLFNFFLLTSTVWS